MANKISLRVYKVLNDEKFKIYKEEYGLRKAAKKWKINYWTLYYHLNRNKKLDRIINLSPEVSKYIAKQTVKLKHK